MAKSKGREVEGNNLISLETLDGRDSEENVMSREGKQIYKKQLR